MIDITVLGSGSSGNGYVLDDGKTKIMLEAGIPYNKAAPKIGFDFANMPAIFVTHEHGDHSKYISTYLAKTSARAYMSLGTATALSDVNSYHIETMLPFKPVRVGTWTVTGFPVEHDAAEPFGYLCETDAGDRLVYVTDTEFVKYRFKNVTDLMVEMNYAEDIAADADHKKWLNHSLHERIMNTHFEMNASLAFIKANQSPRLRSIMLLHISKNDGDPERFKKLVESETGIPVTIAK